MKVTLMPTPMAIILPHLQRKIKSIFNPPFSCVGICQQYSNGNNIIRIYKQTKRRLSLLFLSQLINFYVISNIGSFITYNTVFID